LSYVTTNQGAPAPAAQGKAAAAGSPLSPPASADNYPDRG